MNDRSDEARINCICDGTAIFGFNGRKVTVRQNYSLRFSLAHSISPGKGFKYQLSKVSRLILIDFAYFKSFNG